MSLNHVLVTQAGLDDLKAELADLSDNKRPGLVERLKLARSMGDLSENSDYINAKEELEFLDSRIDELNELIKNSQVSVPSSNSAVSFGHTVKVRLNSSDTLFHIVGEPEADPTKGRISHSSPLGQVGDTIEVEAPVGKILYTVLSIA